jgi:ubiquinone/menaquinone biosynthesis C-methylase UbiE
LDKQGGGNVPNATLAPRLAAVIGAYDTVADAYAARFFHELEGKPLDCMLLQRFAELTRGRGRVCEIGCGTGQIARFLCDMNVDIVGLDISSKMVETARRLCPDIDFRQGDMFGLPWADAELAGVVGFYAIVHCDESEVQQTFREIARVLQPGGWALLSFHVGNEVMHVEEFLGQCIDVDFHFQEPNSVLSAAAAVGLVRQEFLIRHPYGEDVEYPSHRAYLLAQRPG